MARLPETPIERIFREVMGQRMPPAIKAVLLSESSPADSSNVLDYPGSMSQWEKESLAAEARLSSNGKRLRSKTVTKRKR